MIQFQTITEFLSEYGKIFIKNDSVGMRCPLCGDSKKSKLKRRFSVKYDNGSAFYSCFNCGKEGTFAELVAELKGITIGDAIRQVSTIEFDDIKKTLTTQPSASEKITPKEQTDFNYILDDCISISDETNGYIDKQYQTILKTFISKRQIPKDYDIYVATKGEYKGRYVIPVVEDGNIVYFQGRATNDDMYLRFKNPEIEKTGIIMNIKYFDKNRFIIVTEGIIDAMMIENHQGTCVLGGSISDEFLSTLYKYTDRDIIIAVDNDERGQRERIKLIRDSKFGMMLKYFITPTPIKDLNEYKIKRNIDNMYDTIVRDCVDHWTLLIKHAI